MFPKALIIRLDKRENQVRVIRVCAPLDNLAKKNDEASPYYFKYSWTTLPERSGDNKTLALHVSSSEASTI